MLLEAIARWQYRVWHSTSPLAEKLASNLRQSTSILGKQNQRYPTQWSLILPTIIRLNYRALKVEMWWNETEEFGEWSPFFWKSEFFLRKYEKIRKKFGFSEMFSDFLKFFRISRYFWGLHRIQKIDIFLLRSARKCCSGHANMVPELFSGRNMSIRRSLTVFIIASAMFWMQHSQWMFTEALYKCVIN
jgi:hypothetical protein